MRKFICFILIVTLCIGMSSGAFAQENSKEKNKIFVTLDESGSFYVDASSASGSKEIARVTDEDGIYSLKDGTLLSSTGVGSYQIVDRIEVTLTDSEAVTNLLSDAGLSDNIKNSLAKESAEAIEKGNSDTTAVIFVPKKSLTRASSTRYYTYNGHPMMEELIYYYNKSTTWETVKTGTTCNTVAKSITSVIMDATGYASIPVAVFNSAMNAYQAYAAAVGSNPISGSSSDKLMINLDYDLYNKYTYADLGYGDGYRLGCVTMQVKLLDSEFYHYYFNYNGGKEITTTKVINTTVKSANYASPSAQACLSVNNPWVETVEGKIYNHPIYY